MGELMLPEEKKDLVLGATERIHVRMRRTAEDLIMIGKDLSLIKENLDHGLFGEWVSQNFEMTHRTANNFINVYLRFEDSISELDHIKPSILYQLAAPSTPDEVVEKVIDMDHSPTVKELQMLKSELKNEKAKREQIEQHRDQVLNETQRKMDEAAEEIRQLREQNKPDTIVQAPEGWVSPDELHCAALTVLLSEAKSMIPKIKKNDSEYFKKLVNELQAVNGAFSQVLS